MDEQSQSSEQQIQPATKASLIQTVQTPLGFFTLTILVAEGISYALISGIDALDTLARANLLAGNLAFLFFSFVLVAAITFLRPYALSGKTPPAEALPCTEMISKVAKLNKNAEDLSNSAKEIASVFDTLFPQGQPTHIEPAELKFVTALIRDQVHFSNNVLSESKDFRDLVVERCKPDLPPHSGG